jgi:hypothetical protein
MPQGFAEGWDSTEALPPGRPLSGSVPGTRKPLHEAEGLLGKIQIAA